MKHPAHWPMFRGVAAAGVYDGGPTATTWDVEAGEGIEWSTEIPGLGHSSPVVWGDQLFITTAMVRRVNVYEAFIEGAKEGFETAIRIIPYLLAMLVAIVGVPLFWSI